MNTNWVFFLAWSIFFAGFEFGMVLDGRPAYHLVLLVLQVAVASYFTRGFLKGMGGDGE